MNFFTGLIMGTMVFIVVAYAIIFNMIGRQLDELRETIQDIEDMIYDKDHEEFYDDDNSKEDDDEDDLEEGDV